MEQKLRDHEIVKALYTIAQDAKESYPILAGGAIADIIDNREPKDYDLIVTGDQKEFIRALENCGYRFFTDSRTATTYFRHKIRVQILKTHIKDFDFTVSQSLVSLKDLSMELRKHELENKLLIPVNYTDKKAILSSLSRIPHWMRKGYRIEEETYYTLLNGLQERNCRETNKVAIPYRS